MITKYINHENGYFYLSEYDKKNRKLHKRFYSTDSIFLYGSTSTRYASGQEITIEFYDSLGQALYTLINDYQDESNIIEKQCQVFGDGTVKEILYAYDQYNNLKSIREIGEQNTGITEMHRRAYDDYGRIIHDTIDYPEKRTVIGKKYKDNKLFYQTQKDITKDTGGKTVSMNKNYLKKYYLYNTDGRISEIRNIRIFPDANSFGIYSRIRYTYSGNLVEREDHYNSNDRKIFTIQKKYIR